MRHRDPGTDDWQGRSTEDWRRRWGLPLLHAYLHIDSTNDAVRRLAARGAPAGATVIADHQSAGRGRRGRAWADQPGRSLLLSMLFRPEPLASVGVLTLRLGLAAAAAVEAVAPVHVQLKWPNDLVVNGRKLGGILCEGAVQERRTLFVVAGMGLNISQPDDAWPPELEGRAISLAAAGCPVDRAEVAGVLVRAWLDTLRRNPTRLSAQEIARFQARDALRGQRITVDGAPAGQAAGITDEGVLLARIGPEIRHITSGTVRTASEAANP